MKNEPGKRRTMKMKTIPCLILALLSMPAIGQEQGIGWKHYDFNGIGLDVPPVFSMGTEDEYHTIDFPNTADPKIALSVSCLLPHAQFTPAGLESYRGDDYHYFDTITYHIQKKGYFVLSGWSTDGRILYIKGLKKGKAYFELALSYPANERKLLDGAIAKMAASFK